MIKSSILSCRIFRIIVTNLMFSSNAYFNDVKKEEKNVEKNYLKICTTINSGCLLYVV